MGISKKNNQIEIITTNAIGEEIHSFDGPNGKARIKKASMFSRLPSDKQFCPECHKSIIHKKNYWECDICNYSITDKEVEDGYGYPTLESSYENDYGILYGENEGDIPEACEACGGPYPDCRTSCKIFD